MIKIDRPECPYPAALAVGNYKHERNKNALKLSAHDKCMYCECKISHIDFAHVEHIKPKAEGKFPELEFVWENLGYACPKCNNAKLDKYYSDTPYLNPYDEDPSDHIFAYGAFLFSKAGCERAELTINDIQLNRPELLEKRQQRIEEIKRALYMCWRTESLPLREAALAELNKEWERDKELSIFVRAFLLASSDTASI